MTPKRLDDAELGAVEKALCEKAHCLNCNEKRRLLAHIAYLTKSRATVADNALSVVEHFAKAARKT